MITKKSNEKFEICLSIKVFIDFGANTAHSVNMGNENVEPVLTLLQINWGKIKKWKVKNKACV